MFVPKDEHPCFPSIFSYFLAASDSASVPDFSTFGRQDSSSLTVLMRTSIRGLSLWSVATRAILSMMASPLTVSPKTV